ncbi:M16 family metallopeptidase [Tenacibaculum sp. TC6]|uniref:M16 family metallopeptidase n=1 Tax=Tenacibaculum sp. TC6 TaxID=3423223 RepID=UPI003D368F06
MKKTFLHLFALIILLSISCKVSQAQKTTFINSSDNTNTDKYKLIIKTDTNGFTYEEVTNDPSKLRLYTLNNGLKVYLSKNDRTPTIQTYLAVRTGSVNDPLDNTGLAHYLEHMLFKGTTNYGTVNWEKESKEIDVIADLYEKHKATNNNNIKKSIYRKIDSVSQIASKYVVANEYDNMVTDLGATGTNAHTSFEETIYKNTIPSNELDKWLFLESERFKKVVLRLFHTELEAVYEEFNQAQDNEGGKMYYTMLAALFPDHVYGKPVIGEASHLKNPSMKAIDSYFNTYYVPNNMAICLSGDLDYDKTINMINKYFGNYQRKDFSKPEVPHSPPLTNIITKEVTSPSKPYLMLAYKINEGMGHKSEQYISLINNIFQNSGGVGLIDKINEEQKVLSARVNYDMNSKYGYQYFNIIPKEGQTLEEAKNIILNEIEKVKNGKFEDWLLPATINNIKLRSQNQYQSNTNRAQTFYHAFIHNQEWLDYVNYEDRLSKINKEDLINFAKRFFQNNYVIVYKKEGEKSDMVKVKNPKITPIQIDRSRQSDYTLNFNNIESSKLSPKFISYEEKQQFINTSKLKNGIEFNFVKNKETNLFTLSFIYKIGSKHNKKLSLASSYATMLDSEKYSLNYLKNEFYKLGLTYSFQVSGEESFISLSGLEENLGKGLELLLYYINNLKPDKQKYQQLVSSILQGRERSKNSKNGIWSSLQSYIIYGKDPINDQYSKSELETINHEKLLTELKSIFKYSEKIYYYGSNKKQVIQLVDTLYKPLLPKIETPSKKEYFPLSTNDKKVFLKDFDMVQAEIFMFSNQGKKYDAKHLATAALFNNYFGSGMSSIVFQEIREAKSLAYSASIYYSTPYKNDESNILQASVSTQSNKLEEVITTLNQLLNGKLPKSIEKFNITKENMLKKYATSRPHISNYFYDVESIKKLKEENSYIPSENIYNELTKLTFNDIANFYEENIKNKNFRYAIMTNIKDINKKILEKTGTIEEINTDEIFKQ